VDLGSNGGQGHGVEGAYSGGEDHWLASWWWHHARHGGCEMDMFCRKYGRGAGGARKEAGWAMGMAWQREGSDQEGPGRLWAVVSSIGSSG